MSQSSNSSNSNKQYRRPSSLDPVAIQKRKNQQRKWAGIDASNQKKRMADIRQLTSKRGKSPNKLSEHPMTPNKDIKSQTRNIKTNKKTKSKTNKSQNSDLPKVKFKRKFTPAYNNTIAYRKAPPTKVTPNKNVKYGSTQPPPPREPTPEPTEEEKQRKKERKKARDQEKKRKKAFGW